jgi:hypothetical protein
MRRSLKMSGYRGRPQLADWWPGKRANTSVVPAFARVSTRTLTWGARRLPLQRMQYRQPAAAVSGASHRLSEPGYGRPVESRTRACAATNRAELPWLGTVHALVAVNAVVLAWSWSV